MKTIQLTCLLLTALLFLPMSSCKKDAPVDHFSGYSYFPLQVGHTLIYQVDSIVKNEFNLGVIDTFRFQIKEVVESFFTDMEGRQTARLERYKRANPAEPWIIYKVWTANLLSNRAEKKEDNITYIKLVFPPRLNLRWNGNAYNELEEQDYVITSIHTPEVVNGLAFDSVLTVLQADEDNIVFKKYELEKYAAGAGLVYKEQFNGSYGLQGGMYVLKNFIHYTEKIISD